MTTLRGISEIRGFFRTNETPIYFVSPTAFNLLGIDRWVRNFFYVNYFDSFEGSHPRVIVPRDRPYREFNSIEEICNYLLRHREMLELSACAGPAARWCSCSSTKRPRPVRPRPASRWRCRRPSFGVGSTPRS